MTAQERHGRAPSGFSALLCATPAAVRESLAKLEAWLAASGLLAEDAATVELVVAEVLNNVVEHAYCGQDDGAILLRAAWCRRGLAVCVRDFGGPMPGGRLPRGAPRPLDVPLEELPEGGFGWFLVNRLADDLSYRRRGNVNDLSFRILLDAA